MDRDAIRAFALRDRTAVEALRHRHWAEVRRTRGPEAMLRVAWALREHARRVRPDWPGAAARVEDLEHPDIIVMDLDPGPDVAWRDVIGAAKRVRDILGELGFASFPRLTGGKGLHVVVPLGQADVNISAMQVGRREPRGAAVMVLAVDEPISAEVLAQIRAVPNMADVRVVRL